MNNISEEYKDIKNRLYSKEHLYYIIDKKGKQEVNKIEKKYINLIKKLEKDEEVLEEKDRIKNKLTRGEYGELELEIKELKTSIENIKNKEEKDGINKIILNELRREKEELLLEKISKKEKLDLKIKEELNKEINYNKNEKIIKINQIKIILKNIKAVKNTDEIFKKYEEKKSKKIKKKEIKGENNNIKSNERLRGNFSLKDIKDIEEWEE